MTSREWEVTSHCSIWPPPFDDVLVVSGKKTTKERVSKRKRKRKKDRDLKGESI
jgi:hypothetical protein